MLQHFEFKNKKGLFKIVFLLDSKLINLLLESALVRKYKFAFRLELNGNVLQMSDSILNLESKESLNELNFQLKENIQIREDFKR